MLNRGIVVGENPLVGEVEDVGVDERRPIVRPRGGETSKAKETCLLSCCMIRQDELVDWECKLANKATIIESKIVTDEKLHQ